MAEFDLDNLPENVKAIPLTKGYHALVDADWYEMLSLYKWHTKEPKTQGCTPYAGICITLTNEYGRKVYAEKMHRIIMDAPSHLEVDHINGNGLDNRRSNLRLCTKSQNIMNMRPTQGSSRFKGVSYNKDMDKWHSYIRVVSKRTHLGFYTTEEEAANAYNNAASMYFGTHARLNIV